MPNSRATSRRSIIRPTDPTDLALLRKLKGAGVPVVSVFLSGRPLFVSPEINASDAFVAAWLPGTAGRRDRRRAGRRLGRKDPRDFTGRLPFAWPADARSPVTEPLFARGYGLSYAKPGHVAQLSEDPKMDVAAALNVQNFFARGVALSPWALTINDVGGARAVTTGAVATPGGLLSVTPVDLGAQEDARLFRWSGNGSLSIAGPNADLSRQLNNAFALRLDGRVDALGSGPVRIAIENTVLDATDLLRAQPAGKPFTVKIPLRCFADAGANLGSVATPLRIEGSAGLALVLQSARVEAVGENLACPPVAH